MSVTKTSQFQVNKARKMRGILQDEIWQAGISMNKSISFENVTFLLYQLVSFFTTVNMKLRQKSLVIKSPL